jgi:hypothetical protein
MDIKEAIFTIKERIKTLSANQTLAKRARKTTIPYGELYEIKKKLGGLKKDWWCAQGYVADHRIEITALLNFYHEIRNSEYRHGICLGTKWYYDRQYDKLKNEFALKGGDNVKNIV